MVMASLDFLFASYPKLRMEGVSNLEVPTATDKINPKKKPYFSIKKIIIIIITHKRRAAQQDRKLSDNIQSAPAKHHRKKKKISPTLSGPAKVKLRAWTSTLPRQQETSNSHVPIPTRVASEKSKQGARKFHPGEIQSLPHKILPLQWQWKPRREPRFLPTFSSNEMHHPLHAGMM